jgi:hypothetical protein
LIIDFIGCQKETLKVFAFCEGNELQMVYAVCVGLEKYKAFSGFSSDFGQEEPETIELKVC